MSGYFGAEHADVMAVSAGYPKFEGSCMFGFSSKTEVIKANAAPVGAAEVILCVFDEKRRLLHHFLSHTEPVSGEDSFRFLNDPSMAFENNVVCEAIATNQPASVGLVYGDGCRKCLHVLPYEHKRRKWRYACLQISRREDGSRDTEHEGNCALAPERCAMMLVDANQTIRTAGSQIPQAFGFTSRTLVGMSLSDLFSPIDTEVISSCSANTNEPILSCVFYCLDGSKRDVEIRKYSAPDHLMLYIISDMTPQKSTEDMSQVTMRERRRIGQDLHDSIGQLLTGISLLSRSLANSLKRIGNAGEEDAFQISSLADEASNQIRQISRGLMPSEIVKKGLFDSLRELARNTSASCGLHCVTRIDEAVSFADGAVETHLYRIAQEAVNNSVRHAGASRIDIVVAQEHGIPRLEVIDDGTWKGLTENISGMGMKTMEYRAIAIGGHLKVGARPQGGSQVRCVLESDEIMVIEA